MKAYEAVITMEPMTMLGQIQRGHDHHLGIS